MQSTPSSKSSTSSDELRSRYIADCLARGDHKALLLDLLAIIHRDGGHYTELVGLQASIEDAEKKVPLAYRKIASMMFGRRKA